MARQGLVDVGVGLVGNNPVAEASANGAGARGSLRELDGEMCGPDGHGFE